MNESQNKYEINILQMVGALLKKWWIIVISAILCAALSFSYTYFCITPLYRAEVSFYVNNSSISAAASAISASQLSAAQTLVNTYREILTTRLTLEEVIKEANLPYSYAQLRAMVDSRAVANTEIFKVTVTEADPEEACMIANTILKVLPEKIASIIVGSSASVVDAAVVPTGRYSPSYSRNTVLGLLIGAVLSAAVIILLEVLNDTIQNEDWVLQYFKEDIPLLTIIPDVTANNRKGSYYGYRGYRSRGSYRSADYYSSKSTRK